MIAIAAPVAGVFALVVVVLAIFFVVRKNKTYSTAAQGPPSVIAGTVTSETRSSNPTIITKDLRVTYPEVLKPPPTVHLGRGKGKKLTLLFLRRLVFFSSSTSSKFLPQVSLFVTEMIVSSSSETSLNPQIFEYRFRSETEERLCLFDRSTVGGETKGQERRSPQQQAP